MATRLKDIALETGYSINTVSLALNGSCRISDETRRAIAETAKRLHYMPNKAARALVTQRSNLIGLAVREMNNVITNEVAASVERKLSKQGYSMLFASTAQHIGELETLRMLQSQQVDGILMFPTLPPDTRVLKFIEQSKIPVVLLSYGEYDLPVDAVYVDKTHAAYIVTQYLIELGHRRIAFISNSAGSDQTQLDCEKFNGYTRALSDHGIAFDPTLTVFAAANTFQAGYDSARHLFRRSEATAVYGSSDLLACGAMNYYLAHGVRIPQDLSIVSNDSTEIAVYAPVALTASYYPVEALTEQAAGLLLRRLSEKPSERLPHQRVVLKPELRVRASTARLA